MLVMYRSRSFLHGQHYKENPAVTLNALRPSFLLTVTVFTSGPGIGQINFKFEIHSFASEH